jgi:hypothetical protein
MAVSYSSVLLIIRSEDENKFWSAARAISDILKHRRANTPKNTALALLDGKSQLNS